MEVGLFGAFGAFVAPIAAVVLKPEPEHAQIIIALALLVNLVTATRHHAYLTISVLGLNGLFALSRVVGDFNQELVNVLDLITQ